MESNTTTVLSVIALIVSVGGTIIGIFNHKRVVSKCCGRKADISLDIQDTRVDLPSPPQQPKKEEV